MRVLVTGGAGFIGSSVCARLAKEGHEVLAIDNFQDTLYSSTARRRLMEVLPGQVGFDFKELDLRDAQALDNVDVPDVIIHEAAVPGLLPSWNSFDEYLTCNVQALKNILEFARKAPECHLVLASTSSVYGSSCVGDETLPLRPVSPYGVTKLSAEYLLNAYRQTHGVSASVLRYFSVFGPRQRPDMAYSRFCNMLLEGTPLPVTGDGTQSRSMTYIDDIVSATVLASEVRPDGEAMNVSGSEEMSVLEVIAILSDELGVRPKLAFEPWRTGDQVRTSGNSTRAKNVLGWEARTSTEEGLRRQARQALDDFESTQAPG